MPIYRNADCWGVARANAEAARKEAQSKATQVNHEHRELNRRLAERLVLGWSAYEYRQKFDDEIAKALDGEHDGVFDVNAERYRTPVAEKHIGASDAAVATVAARHERKRREASFVSSQMDRRNNESTEK